MPRPTPRPHEPRKPKPKYLDGSVPTTKQRSLDQENSVARTLSGARQPGSGCFTFKEGDVITDSHLIECKTTKKRSFSVTVDLLEKIDREAYQQQRRPAVCLRFEDCGNLEDQDMNQWVLLPLNDFKALLGD